jgi:hypothetical protein
MLLHSTVPLVELFPLTVLGQWDLLVAILAAAYYVLSALYYLHANVQVVSSWWRRRRGTEG